MRFVISYTFGGMIKFSKSWMGRPETIFDEIAKKRGTKGIGNNAEQKSKI